eukprot:CAMPEP_0178477098 /NCGR_PEP_ID=MMETSP0696-20121128/3960_1 /TAXON_ID=265572 /ORGANISM="Extubocellulus spinifer, Strain CCMP396" /LENGTH=91 /DNA_ID=CAMNT_0020104407 /DNA_START=172 /DNA_END=448 /DNA_ORIENTATION=-
MNKYACIRSSFQSLPPIPFANASVGFFVVIRTAIAIAITIAVAVAIAISIATAHVATTAHPPHILDGTPLLRRTMDTLADQAYRDSTTEMA